MPGRLQGKIAIVTGASSGVGRAISLEYANEGAILICSDLQPTSRLKSEIEEGETAQLINDRGGKAVFIKCDVGDPSQFEALVADTVKKFERLDM
jgi:NAD(P)-dependent dehydrogenase (short-subunit alcohol dehydrogenase family)